MRRWLIRIGKGLLGLVVLLALLAGGLVAGFRWSVPSYDGTITVAGLEAPVEIVRDRYGIPHITAQSFSDAAFGLGYAHAQDRLWQMEVTRRFIQGRVSELFGESAFGTDTFMRTMGLYAAGEEALTHLSPEALRVLQSYSDGVNAYIGSHRGLWPVEFVVTGDTPPEPWRPADSIAVLKGMAMQLSGNAFGEAARAQLASVLGRQSVQDFFPPFSASPLPGYMDELYGMTQTGQAYGVPDITASDNWVVDGAHSETGKPLLANDPHLGFSIPSVWYLAHLAIPGEDIAGGTLTGMPVVIAGRNRHVAWGMTNTGPDTQDLYLERINPDNSRQYQVPGGFAEFDSRIETIRVRFGADRQIVVRTTRHGPVMPEGSTLGDAPSGYVTALDWTALEEDDTSFDGALGINRAANVAEMREAARSVITPMQNIVYADDEDEGGHIGLILPGRIPIRSDSNDSLGLVPAPGWDGRYDWRGFVPPEDNFVIGDPASGWIATANNKTVADDYTPILTREWEPDYRYRRIETLLKATPKHSLASFRAMQLDAVDNYALELKPRLMKAGPFPADIAKAASLVADWDGAMLGSRPEPLIFSAWARALSRRLYADELGANFGAHVGFHTEFTLRVLDDVEDESRWCDDKGTADVEDCASRIRLALQDAAGELSAAYGSDPESWRWGSAHRALHRAQPFGGFPYIGRFFNREADMDGGAFTLLRSDYSMRGPRPYAGIHGAGYRAIYDLADPDRSLYVISTGQSGNLFSPHYDDLLPVWAKGDYVAIPTAKESIAAAAVNRLTLQPPNSANVP